MANSNQDEHNNLEEMTRRARLEMQTNPQAVRQRLIARGATEEQVSGLFANLGFDLPAAPQTGQTVLPTQQIQPASAQYGEGAYTTPSGQTVLPTQQIRPASVVAGPGAQTLPSGQIAMPTVPIRAGAPMTDEDILRGGMYVQPQQGVVAGKQ
jgi:hypothetical protein|tara:strand:- start:2058 stop:2516 length:459 start_codon:yes stop_codon:yes gene_type:complete